MFNLSIIYHWKTSGYTLMRCVCASARERVQLSNALRSNSLSDDCNLHNLSSKTCCYSSDFAFTDTGFDCERRHSTVATACCLVQFVWGKTWKPADVNMFYKLSFYLYLRLSFFYNFKDLTPSCKSILIKEKNLHFAPRLHCETQHSTCCTVAGLQFSK